MGNKSFRFKQFEVFHDRCAMKVGTDGVLLGAWSEISDQSQILDIGTGTGLISLMLSQRAPNANIVAIEIDLDAAEQATENVSNSPFHKNIEVLNISFQQFASSTKCIFDAIVCNPPFFVNSLHSPINSRTNARHADSLSLSDILFHSKQIISKHGKLFFIYPFEELANIDDIITQNGWYIYRQTNVYSKIEAQKPIRVLYELGDKMPTSGMIIDSLVIEKERHIYTSQYIELTKEYYLNM